MNRWLVNSPFYQLQTHHGAVGGAIAGGIGLYSAWKQGEAADDAADSMGDATDAQIMLAMRQMDLSEEQWDLYKNDIYPMELEAREMGISAQELALQRGGIDAKLYEDFYAPLQESFVTDAMTGIKPQYDRVARDARIQVDRAYDTAEGEMQRNVERRGLQPGSGSSRAAIGDTSLNRAATKALGVRQAVEGERDRVETQNFNRKAVALGRQPTASMPTQGFGSGGINSAAATAGLNNASYGLGSAARSYGNQANMAGNNAAGAFGSAIQLGMGAYDTYNKYANPSQPQLNTSGNTSYSPNYTSSNPWANPAIGGPRQLPDEAYAQGGLVQPPGYAGGGPVQPPALGREAYAGGGMVNGPPGVDQVPGSVTGPDGASGPVDLTAGEYVIPADVVRAVGTDPLDEIIAKARERKQKAASGGALSLARMGA